MENNFRNDVAHEAVTHKDGNTIIRETARKTGYRYADVKAVVEALFEVILQDVHDGFTCRISFLEVGRRLIKKVSFVSQLTQKQHDIAEHYMMYVKVRKTYKHVLAPDRDKFGKSEVFDEK